MEKLIAGLRAVGEALFLLTVAPCLLLVIVAGLALADLRRWFRRRSPSTNQPVSTGAVSIVIPTWNGRHHLERNLPSVVAALEGNPAHELIVVDNASSDGSAEFLQENFPSVRVLRLDTNRGFGGGSNAGFRAATNDIVVLLNNDMRVEPDFLEGLTQGFSDPRVFAVSAQILFSDPSKRREETGLTHGEWLNGRLHVRHVVDDRVGDLFPTFYAGGGSTAYDRRKFLELGGFDPLMEPFYLEDTDVGYMAWKRGWVVLYQPQSIVYHEHRGTIGTHFSPAFIEAVLQKNYLLFTWKNIHRWSWLAAHFFWLYAALWVQLLTGRAPTRPSIGALVGALRRFGPLLLSRGRAQQLAAIDDLEAFRRPLGGYFRDRFWTLSANQKKLNVLFVSPYPMEPPLHGGAVFMNQTVRQLAELTNLHLICLIDEHCELEANQRLDKICCSAEFMVRWKDQTRAFGALTPHAARTFFSPDLQWVIHRAILQHEIDVVQLEYTQLASYASEYRQIATFLFEHDVYFQSVLRSMKGLRRPIPWLSSAYEYLRALRFERQALEKFDAIQVCTAENRRYLQSYSWNSARIEDGFRAGIDVEKYRFVESGREPDTLLFVGNFRHLPNQQALEFFVHQVLPRVREKRPAVRLIVVGAQAPRSFTQSFHGMDVNFVGPVPDIRLVLQQFAVFVCPILSGSGVRVKLLEAFAAGIPVVSTTIGAEGLTGAKGQILELADSPEEFAQRTVALLENPDQAGQLARRARQEVERKWDARQITCRLERHYREILQEKLERSGESARDSFVLPPTLAEQGSAAEDDVASAQRSL